MCGSVRPRKFKVDVAVDHAYVDVGFCFVALCVAVA